MYTSQTDIGDVSLLHQTCDLRIKNLFSPQKKENKITKFLQMRRFNFIKNNQLLHIYTMKILNNGIITSKIMSICGWHWGIYHTYTHMSQSQRPAATSATHANSKELIDSLAYTLPWRP